MAQTLRIAINGFGRIGRLALRRILSTAPEIEIAYINDLTDAPTLAHLFKYDTVHGRMNAEVHAQENAILIDGQLIPCVKETDPSRLPTQGVDVVLECTGKFTEGEKAIAHLKAGARKVAISAPGKGVIDATIVLGVNDHILIPEMRIVSNASCTTNCLAPMVKVLDEIFGIESGFMNTIHAYTADQRLQDAPHSDLRRARAAAQNIVPTTTGAAKAIGLVMPHLAGKIDGISVRVPVPNGSLTDLTVELKRRATAQEVNEAMKFAAENTLKGILEYSEMPLVSSDILGNSHSCILDALSTNAKGKLVKVLGWYDNEWGYACRLVDLAKRLGKA